MDEAKIEEMVDRFLSWKLPIDFNPDCGISFTPTDAVGNRMEPMGTNLLHAGQARSLVLHLLGWHEKSLTEEIQYLGQMLTATTEADVGRVGAIADRLAELNRRQIDLSLGRRVKERPNPALAPRRPDNDVQVG